MQPFESTGDGKKMVNRGKSSGIFVPLLVFLGSVFFLLFFTQGLPFDLWNGFDVLYPMARDANKTFLQIFRGLFSLPKVWVEHGWDNPFYRFYFFLQGNIFDYNPFVDYLYSIFPYAGIAVLIFLLIRKFLGNVKAALFASVFYVLTPPVFTALITCGDVKVFAQFFFLLCVYLFLKSYFRRERFNKAGIIPEVITQIGILLFAWVGIYTSSSVKILPIILIAFMSVDNWRAIRKYVFLLVGLFFLSIPIGEAGGFLLLLAVLGFLLISVLLSYVKNLKRFIYPSFLVVIGAIGLMVKRSLLFLPFDFKTVMKMLATNPDLQYSGVQMNNLFRPFWPLNIQPSSLVSVLGFWLSWLMIIAIVGKLLSLLSRRASMAGCIEGSQESSFMTFVIIWLVIQIMTYGMFSPEVKYLLTAVIPLTIFMFMILYRAVNMFSKAIVKRSFLIVISFFIAMTYLINLYHIYQIRGSAGSLYIATYKMERFIYEDRFKDKKFNYRELTKILGFDPHYKVPEEDGFFNYTVFDHPFSRTIYRDTRKEAIYGLGKKFGVIYVVSRGKPLEYDKDSGIELFRIAKGINKNSLFDLLRLTFSRILKREISYEVFYIYKYSRDVQLNAPKKKLL